MRGAVNVGGVIKNGGVDVFPEAAAWGAVCISLQKWQHGRLATGGGMGRRFRGRLSCVVFRLRPTEARAHGGVGVLDDGGVGGLPLTWADYVCVSQLRSAAAWAHGRVGGLPLVAWVRGGAGGLGSGGVIGLPFCRLGSI